MIYLLIQKGLPLQGGIEVVGLIWALLGPEEQDAGHIAQHYLQRLPVALIHRQQEGREHGKHHDERRRAHTYRPFEQKEKRYADERPAAETDKLPFRQVEHDLRFDARQVFGYGYISHKFSPPAWLHRGQWALKMLFARLPVLKRVKHRSTV